MADANERTMVYVMIDEKTKFCICALVRSAVALDRVSLVDAAPT